eukprot:CAMPEP_0206016536 /NCGR_PEP_ID=MMETSP1464-20131121/23019_1 /ASSEMBLY_ACC=CAM_ASM_001124 /TAXON_ID=119497 /ORGANISM="Exanthemachrysis gayraliae, Strain RCC1523" /LENGTH=902 /DNA_ID=CAMNT_0053390355 /DNA_START=8 /DNA_END=2716 /DNA_ORIENTATION=+
MVALTAMTATVLVLQLVVQGAAFRVQAQRIGSFASSPTRLSRASPGAFVMTSTQPTTAPPPAKPAAKPSEPEGDDVPALPMDKIDDRIIVGTGSDAHAVLDGIAHEVTVTARRPDGALVLGVRLDSGDSPAFVKSLGNLDIDRYVGAARFKRWWMGPIYGTNGRFVPVETQFLLARLPGAADRPGPDRFVFFMPLVDGGFRSTLGGNVATGRLGLRVSSGDEEVRAHAVDRCLVVAAAADPYEAVHRGFRAAADELEGSFTLREDKAVPASHDWFGWCTWDACYSKVDPNIVLSGVESLTSAGFPPRSVIIDDGWQSVCVPGVGMACDPSASVDTTDHDEREERDGSGFSLSKLGGDLVATFYRRVIEPAPYDSPVARFWRWLTKGPLKGQLLSFFDGQTDFSKALVSFQANRKFRGANGQLDLAALVRKLKDEAGVRSVLCWHALSGYWSGVAPDSKEMSHLNPHWRSPKPTMDLLAVEPAIAWDAAGLRGAGALDLDAIDAFYDGLHGFLKRSGVDGVKVDAQSGLGPFGAGHGVGAPAYVREVVRAMERSAARHFTGPEGAVQCIDCMCHSTENLLAYAQTSVIRAADDFYPKDVASHAAHLQHVAFNSLFLGELGACDWDMFQSKHPSAEIHAAARAVGGCPVYVSDEPGRHDASVLAKVVLPGGAVLRAKHAGRPTRDCMFNDVANDGRTALKIWNRNDHTGVVAAFNVQGSEWSRRLRRYVRMSEAPDVRACASPADVPGLKPAPGADDRFAVYGHQSGAVHVLSGREHTPPRPLGAMEFEVFTVSPVRAVVTKDGDRAEWAPIGLVGLFNSGGAVRGVNGGKGRHTASVRAVRGGPFALYASRAPRAVRVDGERGPFDYDEARQVVTVQLPPSPRDRAGDLALEGPEEADVELEF